MRLFVAIELDDRCGAETLPATRNNDSGKSFPIRNRPSATFITQLIATYLRFPQTRARRRRTQDEVNGSYADVSSPSWREGSTLDRSV